MASIPEKPVDINRINEADLFTDLPEKPRCRAVRAFQIIMDNPYLIDAIRTQVFPQEFVDLMCEAGLHLNDEGDVIGDFYVPLAFRCAAVLNGCYETIFPSPNNKN